MDKEIEILVEDIHNWELPKDFETAYDKVKCPLIGGKKIYWYYKEDKKYFEEEMGETPKDYLNDIFSGIVVPRWGIESHPYSELEIEDVVIVITSYPIEKDYPEVLWTSLKRLIDDEGLVEVFEVEE